MGNPLLERGLRALSAFAGSEFAERYNLHEPAQRWVAKGARLGAAWLPKAADKARQDRDPDATRPAQLFDLTLTESQELICGTMRRFADEVIRPAATEADDALAPPSEVLDMAAELGLAPLAIPQELGGVAEERSPVTWTLIAEELARGDMALALALMAPVSVAHLILDHGTEEQKKERLPELAGDAFVAAAPALLEARAMFDPRKLSTRAKPSSGGFTIRGRKALVPLGRSARFFVVSADLRGRGARLFLVERDRPGVEVRSEPTMGLRGADLVTLDLDVSVPHQAMLGGDESDHQRVIDLGRIGWGALAVGQGQAMLEYVMRYCNERIAFGEPITNRQAVAFMIADIAIELKCMRLLTWRAAARAEEGLPFTREAHLVRVQCAEKAMKIGTDGVQLLGGAGYIREHPVEQWYRHMRAVAIMEGGISP